MDQAQHSIEGPKPDSAHLHQGTANLLHGLIAQLDSLGRLHFWKTESQVDFYGAQFPVGEAGIESAQQSTEGMQPR
jgi:hypothetical protein